MEVWPDNLEAGNVFIQLSTQWRTGMRGVTGLDYNVLPPDMRPGAVMSEQTREIFEAIRVLEDAALEVMRSKK